MAGFFTYVMRHYLPDAYLFAILLTLLSAVLALIFTPSDIMKVVQTWGDGIYGIIGFAMQMILILVTGYCLALTPVSRVLNAIASLATTPVKGAMITAFVAEPGGPDQLGFRPHRGRVPRPGGCQPSAEVGLPAAHRRRLQLPGHLAHGLLRVHPAAAGNAQAVPEPDREAHRPDRPDLRHHPGLVEPHPGPDHAVHDPDPLRPDAPEGGGRAATIIPERAEGAHRGGHRREDGRENPTLAERIDHSYVVNIIFAVMGVAYLGWHFSEKGLRPQPQHRHLPVLHPGRHPPQEAHQLRAGRERLHPRLRRDRPAVPALRRNHGNDDRHGARQGHRGLVRGHLHEGDLLHAAVLGPAASSTCSCPPGAGQWAVQGPITVEAAKMMGIDMTKSAMMVAWGDQWTNMVQPFWALPLLGLAGLSARDIMGYGTMILLWWGVILSASGADDGVRYTVGKIVRLREGPVRRNRPFSVCARRLPSPCAGIPLCGPAPPGPRKSLRERASSRSPTTGSSTRAAPKQRTSGTIRDRR
ncbi:MAG: TIGR00366 family protein [Desulfosudis oleivorans]|nr:TIGR00366 family protein [Desulfosudis oleivorans]